MSKTCRILQQTSQGASQQKMMYWSTHNRWRVELDYKPQPPGYLSPPHTAYFYPGTI